MDVNRVLKSSGSALCKNTGEKYQTIVGDKIISPIANLNIMRFRAITMTLRLTAKPKNVAPKMLPGATLNNKDASKAAQMDDSNKNLLLDTPAMPGHSNR